jgi:hypothetical protein
LYAVSTSQSDLDVREIDHVRVVAEADKFLDQPPVIITNFHAGRSAGGSHDYYSEADYFRPDAANPQGPYVSRDSLSNPDNFNNHRRPSHPSRGQRSPPVRGRAHAPAQPHRQPTEVACNPGYSEERRFDRSRACPGPLRGRRQRPRRARRAASYIRVRANRAPARSMDLLLVRQCAS